MTVGPNAAKIDAKGKAPTNGSFPIDHFKECGAEKEEYIRCLRRQSYDNLSCRYLSKSYLKCRMEHNLMAPESLEHLGFRPGEDTEREKRPVKPTKRKEEEGYVAGVKILGAYYRQGMLGKLFGNFERHVMSDRKKIREEEEELRAKAGREGK
eukprot:GHVQ01027788.1.p1 GENE.GHVQ01027788.1~~GHVQ01027788.1.p1  ORF type:complete len:153 (-),score=20.96 GHVQ01027788.1:314-772(-)